MNEVNLDEKFIIFSFPGVTVYKIGATIYKKVDISCFGNEFEILEKLYVNRTKFLSFLTIPTGLAKSGNTAVVSMVYRGETLTSKNVSPNHSNIKKMLNNVCNTLIELRNICNIIHGDIKNDNITYDGQNFYLIDYGLSIDRDKVFDRPCNLVCTDSFRSPELLENTSYGFPVDMWALGCTLYYWLTGRYLFENSKESINKWFDDGCSLNNIDSPIKNILHELLKRDQSKRITPEKLLKMLEAI